MTKHPDNIKEMRVVAKTVEQNRTLSPPAHHRVRRVMRWRGCPSICWVRLPMMAGVWLGGGARDKTARFPQISQAESVTLRDQMSLRMVPAEQEEPVTGTEAVGEAGSI